MRPTDWSYVEPEEPAVPEPATRAGWIPVLLVLAAVVAAVAWRLR